MPKKVRFADVDEGGSRAFGAGMPRRWPILIPVVCTVDVIIFIVTMYINDCPLHSDHCVWRFLGRLSFQPLWSNPLLGPSSSTLLRMGGLSADMVDRNHHLWRVFTCLWLHVGLIHLFINSFSLLLIGIRLEQEFGMGRVGGVFFLSGIGGALFGDLFTKYQVSAGASIPLFGLLGAMLSKAVSTRSFYQLKWTSLLVNILIALLNFVVGIFPHNNNFANIGGLIFGFLLGFVFLMAVRIGWDPATKKFRIISTYTPHQILLCVVAVLLIAIGLITLIILTSNGVNGSANCSWCHYLSCVPSSRWTCSDDISSPRATCNFVISGNYMFMKCLKNQKSQLFDGFFTASNIKLMCSRLCQLTYG